MMKSYNVKEKILLSLPKQKSQYKSKKEPERLLMTYCYLSLQKTKGNTAVNTVFILPTLFPLTLF